MDIPDVDISITTRELAKMIKEAGIDLANLDEELLIVLLESLLVLLIYSVLLVVF